MLLLLARAADRNSLSWINKRLASLHQIFCTFKIWLFAWANNEDCDALSVNKVFKIS